MDQTFYRIAPSRVTYAEAWRATRSVLEFVLLAIVKTLRIPVGRHLGFASEPFQKVDWEAIGDDAQASLEPDRRRWSELGLRYCFCCRYPQVGPHQECNLVMQSPDGTVFLKIVYELQVAGAIRTSVKTTRLITRLTTGQVLVTCDRGDVFPPEFELAIVRWRPESELLQRHRDRIAALPAAAVVLRDDAQLEREIIELNRDVFDYAVQRGVLVPMTERELQRARETSLPEEAAPPVYVAELAEASERGLVEIPVAEVVPAPPAYSPEFAFVDDPAASRHPRVLAEIDKIQNKKAGGLSGLVLLAVSVALFVVLGGLNWDWKFVLLLIPILLFHESGHFIAMRIFRYRNVRMFFIPLFGAAVTGQNYNVPGWKKVIVSLAGPMPGIVVGAGLGIAAMALDDNALLMEAAALTVFLNAMNLLPFLPLDGGWVMHALVFSRHYRLDIAFRLLTAVGLLASPLLGMKFLAVIGVVMLLGLPSIYRVARIAAHLRESGMPTISQDGKTIPTQTADAIIDQVQAAFPQPLNDNLKARFALQVFENINSRPPGVLASLALGGVYGTSIAAGIGFFVFLTVAPFTDFGEMLSRVATAPSNAYECGTVERWPANPPQFTPAATVIATYDSRSEAEAAFEDAKLNVSGDSRVTRFGQSVLVGLSEKDEPLKNVLVARFSKPDANVIVFDPRQRAMLTLDCVAPGMEAATLVEQEAQAYFYAGYETFAIPPWDPRRQPSADARRAREILRELREFNPYEDERIQSLVRKQKEAAQRGDSQAATKVGKSLTQLAQQITDEYLQKRRAGSDPLERKLAEIWSRQPTFALAIQGGAGETTSPDASAEEPDNPDPPLQQGAAAAFERYQTARTAWALELGSHIGQLPLEDGRPAPGADLAATTAGSVTRNGPYLRFYIEFVSPAEGVSSFAEWLCEKGCGGVKYQFEPVRLE